MRAVADVEEDEDGEEEEEPSGFEAAGGGHGLLGGVGVGIAGLVGAFCALGRGRCWQGTGGWGVRVVEEVGSGER